PVDRPRRAGRRRQRGAERRRGRRDRRSRFGRSSRVTVPQMTASDVPGTGEQVLLAGLGNPGPRYAGNRHNVGFMVADELAARVGGKFKAHKSGAEVLEGRLADRRVVLVKPRAFMNLSGGPVSGAAKFFKVEPGRI